MTTIVISDGSSKSVQAGDKLIFLSDYLSPENNDESLIVSFDGSSNPQCNITPQGGGTPVLVSVTPSFVTQVWRKL